MMSTGAAQQPTACDTGEDEFVHSLKITKMCRKENRSAPLGQWFGNAELYSIPFQVLADGIRGATEIVGEKLVVEFGSDLPPDGACLVGQEGFYAGAKVPPPEGGRHLGRVGIVGAQE